MKPIISFPIELNKYLSAFLFKNMIIICSFEIYFIELFNKISSIII